MNPTSPKLQTGPGISLIPGPSVIPDRVRAAMNRASIDIYAGPLTKVTERCEEGLKRLFGTKGPVFLYAANGHGGWDAALSNTLSKGDRVLVLQSGRFALGWGDMGAAMGLEIEVLPGDWQNTVDLDLLSERLRADKSHSIRAILCTQIDTASGVANDIAAMRQAIDFCNHPALLMVDAIASLGCMPFELENWKIDVAVSASQKGVMCPAGLSFVATSERAMQAHKTADLKTRYWDWSKRNTSDHYQKYCGTPPQQLLFGLAQAIEMIDEEGLQNVFRRHNTLKAATQAAIQSWHNLGIVPNVADTNSQAVSVSVFNLADHNANEIVNHCQDNYNVAFGRGLGELAGKSIRIGHMGHVNAPVLLGAIATLEIAFATMGLESQGAGVRAAINEFGQNSGTLK